MIDQSDASKSADLPEHLVEVLQELDTQQLQETIDFSQKLLAQHLKLDPGELEANNKDIVRVEELPAYTMVVRQEPQGKALYHVTKVRDPDGGEKLNWRYLGLLIND